MLLDNKQTANFTALLFGLQPSSLYYTKLVDADYTGTPAQLFRSEFPYTNPWKLFDDAFHHEQVCVVALCLYVSLVYTTIVFLLIE